LDNRPQKLEGNLSHIVNFIPQYSGSDFPGTDHTKFRDVSLEYEKFLHFVQISGNRPSVSFDDEALRFEMLKWPLDAYLKQKNVKMTHRSAAENELGRGAVEFDTFGRFSGEKHGSGGAAAVCFSEMDLGESGKGFENAIGHIPCQIG
jgi:hypothetical protein